VEYWNFSITPSGRQALQEFPKQPENKCDLLSILFRFFAWEILKSTELNNSTFVN